MRLWTFQNKECVHHLIKDGSFYALRLLCDRIKSIDEAFCYNKQFGSGNNMHEEIVAPIYTFAKIPDEYEPGLNLRVFLKNGSLFWGYFKFDLPNMVMLELDVLVEDIIFIRQVSDIITSGHNVTMNLRSYVESFDKDDCLEALIPCIKKEQIVSLCTFNPVPNFDGYVANYNIIQHNNPMCCKDTQLVLSGDRRVYTIGEYGNLDYNPNYSYDEIGYDLGANGYDGDMTIYEAIRYVNGSVARDIERTAKSLNIPESSYRTVKARKLRIADILNSAII